MIRKLERLDYVAAEGVLPVNLGEKEDPHSVLVEALAPYTRMYKSNNRTERKFDVNIPGVQGLRVEFCESLRSTHGIPSHVHVIKGAIEHLEGIDDGVEEIDEMLRKAGLVRVTSS